MSEAEAKKRWWENASFFVLLLFLGGILFATAYGYASVGLSLFATSGVGVIALLQDRVREAEIERLRERLVQVEKYCHSHGSLHPEPPPAQPWP